MTFGERLKGLREDKDLKQVQLAKIIGVSQKTISNYENDKYFVSSPQMLTTLADYFGVTIPYLLGLENRQSESHFKNENIERSNTLRLNKQGRILLKEFLEFLYQKYSSE